MSASAMPNPTQPCDQTASGPDRSVMWFATRDRGALTPRSSTDRHTSGDTCREPVDRARLTAEALRFATGGRGPIMMPAHRMAQTAPCAEAEGVGVVTSIGDGAITIQHEPIPALGWPAMTMTFQVANAAVLDGLSRGDHVRFRLQTSGDQQVIDQIAKQ